MLEKLRWELRKHPALCPKSYLKTDCKALAWSVFQNLLSSRLKLIAYSAIAFRPEAEVKSARLNNIIKHAPALFTLQDLQGTRFSDYIDIKSTR